MCQAENLTFCLNYIVAASYCLIKMASNKKRHRFNFLALDKLCDIKRIVSVGHFLTSSISPLFSEGTDSSSLLLRLTGSAEGICV